jgi:squalene-hopene/tetraprenyl-beta-curcumene cyclase
LACRSSAASSSKPLVCPGATLEKAAAPANPEARRGAQRGLEYLAHASEAWTTQHGCFGCHVQAVTLEALTVAKHHQYDVKKEDLEAMVRALELGVTAGGHVTGTAFQGQAWARYDQWIDGQHTGELVRYANELLTLQHDDGSVPDDDARLPVTGGTMHTTYQAMQTWRQAYARTADDKWLTPIRKAERYLAIQSQHWNAISDVYLQNVNFALLGLEAAGVGPSEASSLRLQRILLARQNQDGGWGLQKGTSDALATGQTLYALRLAGHQEAESAIARAMSWLLKHQGADGAWRTVHSGQGGAEKGEGMWAVLGLVSVDVMSVAVRGLIDGQHVIDAMDLAIEARDNQAGSVSKVELFVDDLPLAGGCGDQLQYRWRTSGLGEGKHLVDVVVTNHRGAQSRRRFEVYAGHVLLTEIGTRFDERRQATDVTVRNIAASSAEAGRVELDIYSVPHNDNKRGKRVFTQQQMGTPGAMTFSWNGQGSDGTPQPRGRYLAELVLRDSKGTVLQREASLFFHDSEAVQKKQLGEIEGQLSLPGGIGVAANTSVELVDDTGNVLQRVQSTEQGNYRFKNVAAGKYHVRAAKQGWAPQEAPVTASPAAAPSKADLHF